MSERYSSHNGESLVLPLSFIGVEEEELVFDDRTSDRSAKHVTSEARSGSAFLPCLSGPVLNEKVISRIATRGIVKEGIRRKRRRAIEVEKRSVEIIGTALCDQRDLRAGRTALIRICICCSYPKLFDRFRRGA